MSEDNRPSSVECKHGNSKPSADGELQLCTSCGYTVGPVNEKGRLSIENDMERQRRINLRWIGDVMRGKHD